MALGREPAFDLVALRCALHDQPVLACAFSTEQRPPVHNLLLERDHLVDERRVLLRHRVRRLDACHEVAETASAEENGERGLLTLGRVARNEAPLERTLRMPEIAARDAQRLVIDPQLALDLS